VVEALTQVPQLLLEVAVVVVADLFRVLYRLLRAKHYSML
jgi:hypothetical protein